MKRIAALLLAMILIFSLAACGEKKTEANRKPEPAPSGEQIEPHEKPAEKNPAEKEPEEEKPAEEKPAEEKPAEEKPAEEKPAEEQTSAGGVLSDFTAEDLDGNTVDASLLKGHKVNMINVWGTFCGPCINEMPELGELSREYSEKGVQIIGLVGDLMTPDGSYDEDLVQLAQDIVEKTGAAYPHLKPSDDLGIRVLSSIQAFPTTFFVDENGVQIGSAVVGAKSKADWAALLDEVLAQVS